MHFSVNAVTMDYYLSQQGFNQTEREQYLEMIHDDFNEDVDNNRLIKYLLGLSKRDLERLVEGGVTKVTINDDELNEVLGSLSESSKKNFYVRICTLANCIVADYINHQLWENIKRDEPMIMDRYDYCYFINGHMDVKFDEIEE